MGTGIGIVAAGVHKSVKIVDTSEESLQKSRLFTEQWSLKEVQKKKMTSEERFSMLGRFSYFRQLDDLHDCDIVVEAAKEDFNVKANIFR
jgi:3-hydroxybutyryl-CoA dehydrogenase